MHTVGLTVSLGFIKTPTLIPFGKSKYMLEFEISSSPNFGILRIASQIKAAEPK